MERSCSERARIINMPVRVGPAATFRVNHRSPSRRAPFRAAICFPRTPVHASSERTRPSSLCSPHFASIVDPSSHFSRRHPLLAPSTLHIRAPFPCPSALSCHRCWTLGCFFPLDSLSLSTPSVGAYSPVPLRHVEQRAAWRPGPLSLLQPPAAFDC